MADPPTTTPATGCQQPEAERSDGSPAVRPRYTPELVERLLTPPDPPPGAAGHASHVARLFAWVALSAKADWFDALSSPAEDEATLAFEQVVAHFHPALHEVASGGRADVVLASVWETVWRTRTTWPPGVAGLEALLRKFEETRRAVPAAPSPPSEDAP